MMIASPQMPQTHQNQNRAALPSDDAGRYEREVLDGSV
jgi:hypothetical protein